ncbi:MAG TPA: mandelate racemase/muconate lactonizing enzyme family protein [Chloroflexota bacterium]|nr:mandelate racemase/muconate lactonizing enzyme family protein [Chloroflexota bacterium]
MQVTRVTPFLVDSGGSKSWLFVKLETDTGIVGWGEAYTQADRDRAMLAHLEEMGRYLVGRSPFAIKHFTSVMYLDYAMRRPAMDFWCAQSALEQALWDIVGKACGQPVYNLLGGPCRDRIRVYANGWGERSTTPDEYARAAADVVGRGFDALKFDPFTNPWRTHIGRAQEDLAVERVRAVRAAVGPRVEILVEVHRRLAPNEAIRVAARLEPFEPFWYEEPIDAEDIEGLAEVRRRISLPVVTGEALYSKNQYAEVFARRAADILNPDVCNCGGILALKEIGAMAEPWHVTVAPHNYNSTTVGLASTLQVSACMPNFLITEYFVSFEERGRELARTPFEVANGYIALPTTPGLGIELDEAALKRHPLGERRARHIRQYTEE